MTISNAICVRNADVVVKAHFTVDAVPLEMAYVMLTSGFFQHGELSWVNPNPRFLDIRYLAPRDFVISDIVKKENVGTYEDLCTRRSASGTEFFSCVCALEEDDVERICLSHATQGDNLARFSLFIKGSRQNYTDYARQYIDQLSRVHEDLFPKMT